jgi:hypothetical protein
VCKVGFYEIRHEIVQPKIGKNRLGDTSTAPGSTKAGVYQGTRLIEGGFNDSLKAVKHAWGLVKKENLVHLVDKRLIKRHQLN